MESVTMKKNQERKSFFQELRNASAALHDMKPGEKHTLSINANYGHYQLIIGPGSNGDGKKHGDNQIEISGEIHHLFVSPDAVRAQPSIEQRTENLKNTVIMRNCTIHIKDPLGDGDHIAELNDRNKGVHARECINLAGPEGDHLIKEMEQSERMTLEAYKIVQQDILRVLKEHKKDSVESVK